MTFEGFGYRAMMGIAKNTLHVFIHHWKLRNTTNIMLSINLTESYLDIIKKYFQASTVQN